MFRSSGGSGELGGTRATFAGGGGAGALDVGSTGGPLSRARVPPAFFPLGRIRSLVDSAGTAACSSAVGGAGFSGGGGGTDGGSGGGVGSYLASGFTHRVLLSGVSDGWVGLGEVARRNPRPRSANRQNLISERRGRGSVFVGCGPSKSASTSSPARRAPVRPLLAGAAATEPAVM